MASYVRQENQTILWNTIQNVELFNRMLPPQRRPLWFKDIIRGFYEQYKGHRLSRHDLEVLNKSTIEYMVASLRQMAAAPPKRVSFQEEIGVAAAIPLDFRPEFSSNLEKQSIPAVQYANEFSSRQIQYEQMLQREVPAEVNFKETVAEEAIHNMEELLEQQRRQRELDLAPAPVLVPTTRQIQPAPAPTPARRSLVIQSNTESSPVDLSSSLAISELPEVVPTFESTVLATLRELRQELADLRRCILCEKYLPPQEEAEAEATAAADST